MYLCHKATAWYQRFPLVHSPDRMNNTKKVLEKDHKGPTGAGVDHDNVDDVAALRPILSEAEDTSDEEV